ncbi:MAG: glycosyltransferase, partial [Pseudomonadota bacterium]
MQETYRSYGWQLPAETYVQPYLLGSTLAKADKRTVKIDELVFFGRLEHRKGLWMFCQALDRLAAEGHCPKVTFMGRMTPAGGTPSGALLLARAARWPFRVRLLTNYGQQDALDYLSHPSRLAVMPSLADNSPCVVYECIQRSLPFVTCSGSGADEIIAAADHGRVLAEPTAETLANRLSGCLKKGASAARLAFDPEANLAAWDRWHRRIGAAKNAWPNQPVAAEPAAESRRLIVLVDELDLPLSDVFAAINDNARRLTTNSDIALLTPRDGLIGPWLDQMLAIMAAASGASIQRLGPEDLENVLADRACVVVTAVSARLIIATIDRCAVLISGNQNSIASCLPTGRTDNPVVQRHALPFGEIPELAAFGEPLTGGICVAEGATTISGLMSATKAATRHGDWPSASEICEELVTRHLADGGRLHGVTRHMLGLFAGRPGARGWRRALSGG